jgi:hypothetical protein
VGRDPWVGGEPVPDLDPFVGGVVVHHQVQLGVGVGAGDLFQEGQELLVAMPGLAGAGHGAGGDLQGGEQGGGAVPHIVVAAAFRAAGLHREHLLGPVQRLDLGLLIHAQHNRVLRRRQVQPDHVADLGDDQTVKPVLSSSTGLLVVDLDSSEVKLFEAVLAWKRSHTRPVTTLRELVDPVFDYGTITTLRQSQVRLDKAQRQQVADQYRAGIAVKDIAVKDIAAAFGVHRKTVRDIAVEAGLDPHPRGLHPEDVGRAATLYRAGWSLVRVGEDFGVNASTVMNALKREGVEMRPRQGGRRAQGGAEYC